MSEIQYPRTRKSDPIEYRRHFRFDGNRGGTCVYAWHNLGESWVNVATAICSFDDSYSKKVANGLIQQSIAAGQYIRIPVPCVEGKLTRKTLLPEQLEAIVLMVFGVYFGTSKVIYDEFGDSVITTRRII